MVGLDVDVSAAYDFYKRFILGHAKEKEDIYRKYGFSPRTASTDWEVFAAVLLKDRKNPRARYGADLERHEVKSAVHGGSFEYQYHRNTGLVKLKEDTIVDHVFIARSPSYAEVEAWWVNRQVLMPKFDEWLPELIANYEREDRQRFRKSVTYGFVAQNGSLLLRIEGQRLVFPFSN